MEEAIKAVAEAAANVAVNAAVNATVEAVSEELDGLGEPVVIELDEGESERHDEGAYVTFEEVIEVEDYKASDLEAL